MTLEDARTLVAMADAGRWPAGAQIEAEARALVRRARAGAIE